MFYFVRTYRKIFIALIGDRRDLRQMVVEAHFHSLPAGASDHRRQGSGDDTPGKDQHVEAPWMQTDMCPRL